MGENLMSLVDDAIEAVDELYSDVEKDLDDGCNIVKGYIQDLETEIEELKEEIESLKEEIETLTDH